MPQALSARLAAIVDALPLRPGLRVLEIGCGPGAAAREIARRIGEGHVLAIDRSATAIVQAKAASRGSLCTTSRWRCGSARWTGAIPRRDGWRCGGLRRH
jgi:cyclopropane fatty-acyl-phospholipid synthase-like methyltransferase